VCAGRDAEWDAAASVISQMPTELLAFLDELLSYLESVRDIGGKEGSPASRSREIAVDPENAGAARRGVRGGPETLTRSGLLTPKSNLIRCSCGAALVPLPVFG
jgi:hypothetical protein